MEPYYYSTLRRDIASGHWLLWPDSPGCVRSACGVAWARFPDSVADFSWVSLLFLAGLFQREMPFVSRAYSI